MGSTNGELKVSKLPPKLYKYNNEGHRDATEIFKTYPSKVNAKINYKYKLPQIII